MSSRSANGAGGAAALYEERYRRGYLETWPAAKRRRVASLMAGLGLRPTGRALDFGCGNGVFTAVLREVLPGWRIVGCDLSPTAIDNARSRVPGCDFALIGATRGPFDLIFTHHVLEHVSELEAVVENLVSWLAPGGSMLHVLPCGNPGSFEHGLCVGRPGGIDPGTGRFFFEEPGHVRRLTLLQAEAIFGRRGLELGSAWFANQQWGAVAWITENDPRFIRNLAGHRPSIAAALLALGALRYPAALVESPRRFASRKRALAFWAALPLYPLAKAVGAVAAGLAALEWSRRRDDPAGSEMYLHFRSSARRSTAEREPCAG